MADFLSKNRTAAIKTDRYDDNKTISVVGAKGLTLDKPSVRIRLVNTSAKNFVVSLTDRKGSDIYRNKATQTVGYDKPILLQELMYENSADTDQKLTATIETDGLDIETFIGMLIYGSMQLTELKVESENLRGQTTQNFLVARWSWDDGTPNVRRKPFKVGTIKGQELNDAMVAGPFEVPGECLLNTERSLEYRVLAQAGDEPNIVTVELYFENYVTLNDMHAALLKRSREIAEATAQ